MSRISPQIQQISSETFDKSFQIIQEIDHGSYGTVIKVFDRNKSQLIAMKRLIDNSSLDTMISQSKIMKKINHPNILGCLGFYYINEKSKYILSMPYCQNGSLRKNIKDIDLKGPNFKIRVCYQLAKAINALHQGNVMHRDISPANILFDENWEVKVCDFGFSKSDIDREQSTNVGTQAYRDPNIRGGKYSKKCDIYSAGLVMDYLFRGKSIFKADKNTPFQNQYINFLNNKTDIINGLNCPEQLKLIIINCIQSEQSRRYNSKQLLARIQKLSQKYQYNDPQSIQQQYFQSIHSIEVQTQEQRKLREQRIYKKFQKKKPEFLKMKTQVQISKEEEYRNGRIPFRQSLDISNIQSAHNISLTMSLYQIDLIEELNQKKKKSFTQNSHLNDIKETKQLCQLVLFSKKCSEIKEKIKNFANVYKYYLKRKQEIRKLDKICKLQGVGDRVKKIIIFIGFFTYLQFLKINRSFLNGNIIKQIKDIEGIRLVDMTPKTIDLCLVLIQKQSKMVKTAVKGFVSEIYLNKNFCQKILNKHLMQMLGQAREKNFIEIQKFNRDVVREQFMKIVHPEIFITKDSKEELIRQEIKGLIPYFLE